ncbi:MAG: outer membrane protein assembly factor BamA [Saprospiraceae bacterium]|nr:outer membrane protein assembly factor BamA [Saprospiraceae bacterium]
MMRILFSLLLLCPALLHAQSTADTITPMMVYGKPQDYEIGGIRVTGAQYADAGAVIAIAGFRVGEKIRIPGPSVTKAVKALWDLKLFTDVQIIQERVQENKVFLEIAVTEVPRYSRHSFTGVKKSSHDDLNEVINSHLPKGAILTDNVKATLVYALKKYYSEKGNLDAKIDIKSFPDERSTNAVRLEFAIDPGDKVPIAEIMLVGVQDVKEKTIKKKMKKTSEKSRIFKKSQYVREDYLEDKLAVEAYYNTLGFRDARITRDSIWRNKKGEVMIQLFVDEGNRYYFRNITWKGNTIHDEKLLNQVLGIKKGDVYNQELLESRLSFSQDGRDVSSLYLDNGYLFFRVDPIETAIENDSIDLELRVFEGPQATIDRVVIKGNDRTHEHVIRRELFTRPGDKFSRADIIRSQRQLVNLGYFNPETMTINTPVNPDRGTVDIEYTVEEKPSDQLELSAGYQPSTQFTRGGIIGTLGVTFNNFSLRNVTNPETWNPLPQGDGQRLSLRLQTSGERFQSYNASFTEPWLGGKKPNSMTVAGFYNRFVNGIQGDISYQKLGIIQGTVAFGTRLRFPDDNFIFRAELDLQNLNLFNWPGFVDDEGRLVNNGSYNNYNLGLTLARNSVNDPIFPKSGSLFSLNLQMTPPYSWFKDESFYDTDDVQELYRYVEYVKWRIDAVWYTTLVGKLVLATSAKIGLLGRWSDKTSLTPFERFDLGGDGLNNQNIGLNGRTIVSMRGYAVNDIMNQFPGGAGVFDKFTVELRYPITTSPASTIYVHTFAQAGNAFQRIADFNPFDTRRSFGAGLRVFLPMFGTLGFDYGFGFDKPNIPRGSGLGEYGRFNIVLGFEPD